MTTDEFWKIIDATNTSSGGDMERKCELLKEHLTTVAPQDLRDFIDHFDSADVASYSWPLWGAAYVMHGGCSDDSFSDFRATLISQGRQTYDRALADPESLSELSFDDEEDICYEGFQYIMHEVAEVTLGEQPKSTVSVPEGPTGEEWDEDALDKLYPKLTAKYSCCSGEGESAPTKKPWWKLW